VLDFSKNNMYALDRDKPTLIVQIPFFELKEICGDYYDTT